MAITFLNVCLFCLCAQPNSVQVGAKCMQKTISHSDEKSVSPLPMSLLDHSQNRSGSHESSESLESVLIGRHSGSDSALK